MIRRKMKISFLFLLCCILGSSLSASPPGIPEPGIVLYGRILAKDGITTVPASAVNLRIGRTDDSFGISVIGNVVLSNGGRHYYVARIPFETVLDGFQNTAVLDFDQDQTEDDSYGMQYPDSAQNTVEYSGETDYISPVAGDGSVTSFAFGSGTSRGTVVRMDLQTDFDVSGLPGYSDWISFFPTIPEDRRNKQDDFDGDGATNEIEWLYGTDPTNTNADHRLHDLYVDITTRSDSNVNVVITFYPKWNDGRVYSITKSTTVGSEESFQETQPPIGISDKEQIGDSNAFVAEGSDQPSTDEPSFYRVEVSVEAQQ